MHLKVASCLLQGVELVVHELREVRADRLARAPAQSVITKLALTLGGPEGMSAQA